MIKILKKAEKYRVSPVLTEETRCRIDLYEERHRSNSEYDRVGSTIKELVAESEKTGQPLDKVFMRVARIQNAAHDLKTEHEWLKEIYHIIASEPYDPPLSDDQFKKLHRDAEEFLGKKISLPERNRYFLGLYTQTRMKQRDRAASRLLSGLE